MKIYIVSFLFFLSCNSNCSDNPISVFSDRTTEEIELNSNYNIEVSRMLPNDTTAYQLKFIGINLLDIKIDSSDRRKLSIQRDGLTTDEIEIPTQQSIQGFAVNWIKVTEKGFEISIEYGGSSRYYQKDFRFYYEGEDFVLKDILIETFDKQNPEDEENYINKTETLLTPVKFKDFKIEDFL